jgi:hypothetical protein
MQMLADIPLSTTPKHYFEKRPAATGTCVPVAAFSVSSFPHTTY